MASPDAEKLCIFGTSMWLQIKDIYRRHHKGGYGMLSHGYGCDCFLCQVEKEIIFRLHEKAEAAPAPEREPSELVQDALDAAYAWAERLPPNTYGFREPLDAIRDAIRAALAGDDKEREQFRESWKLMGEDLEALKWKARAEKAEQENVEWQELAENLAAKVVDLERRVSIQTDAETLRDVELLDNYIRSLKSPPFPVDIRDALDRLRSALAAEMPSSVWKNQAKRALTDAFEFQEKLDVVTRKLRRSEARAENAEMGEKAADREVQRLERENAELRWVRDKWREKALRLDGRHRR